LQECFTEGRLYLHELLPRSAGLRQWKL